VKGSLFVIVSPEYGGTKNELSAVRGDGAKKSLNVCLVAVAGMSAKCQGARCISLDKI
jgi:hypothetical protein